MNTRRLFLILAFGLFFSPIQGTAQGLKKVIIDAGHGGKDPGAIGVTGIQEKNVVLSIAQKTADYVKQNFPDVEVILTRDADVFLELHERSAIANKNNADLFISIHANSAGSSSAHGTETFVLGLHKSEANLNVAKRENAVIELEDNHDEHYNFNPNSPEGHIMMSMAQNAYLDQSIFLASEVQDQFENRVSRHNRGVRQAGFYVLYKTTMPSILIELGFLSNPEEEKFLNSLQGQEYMASAVYRAIKDYKEFVDAKWLENEKNKQVQLNGTEESPYPKGRVYRIQVYASKHKAKNNAKVYQDFSDVIVEKASNGIYRYIVNSYESYNSASADLSNVTTKGYQGAYIVAYEADKRVQVYNN
ncbi:N-acetylmuramoyl-L-alanine amidase [Chitinophagales bacterium]|nr:N-acetylmuramoyl-L-alanine amidase [Chitinophagales bacterium]